MAYYYVCGSSFEKSVYEKILRNFKKNSFQIVSAHSIKPYFPNKDIEDQILGVGKIIGITGTASVARRIPISGTVRGFSISLFISEFVYILRFHIPYIQISKISLVSGSSTHHPERDQDPTDVQTLPAPESES